MANRIKGITIEIDGETTKLQKSLKDVDSQLKTTQNNLKDINKLLKLDPTNTELLRQKQKNLSDAIGTTKTRLQELKAAQSQVEKGTQEWDDLQREIIATEQNLKSLEKQHREFGSVASQQIKAVGQAMKDFGGKVTEVGQKLAPLSGAAAGALTALGGLAYKTVQSADELKTLSQQTGISTDELQKMQYAAELVDVSVEDITGALKKLKPKITEDNQALKDLGVATTNVDGSTRDAMDVFYDTLEALSKVENETERDQKAMEIFGKSADSLAGIVDDGGAALKQYGQEAEDLGIILDGETLDSLNEVNDTIDRLKGNVTGSLATLGATLAETFAPVLEKVAGIIGTITEKIRNLSPEQAEQIVKILGIVAAIAPVLLIGGKIITMIGSLVSVIGTIVGVLGGPLTIAIAAVIAIGVLLYKHWDEIKAFAINAWNAIKEGVTDAIEKTKAKAIQLWTNIKTSVMNVVTAIKTGVTNTWNNIKTTVTNVVEGIKSKVLGVWDAIKQGVADRINAMKDNIRARFDEVRNVIHNAVEFIKGIFNFEWHLPHIALPHFRITQQPVDSSLAQFLGISSLPSLSVDWYKKAYENAIMFNRPTVMPTAYGMKGFGDGHGAEIVMGINKLQELVGASGEVIINVYPDAGTDVNALADKVAQRFVAMNRSRKAGGFA